MIEAIVDLRIEKHAADLTDFRSVLLLLSSKACLHLSPAIAEHLNACGIAVLAFVVLMLTRGLVPLPFMVLGTDGVST